MSWLTVAFVRGLRSSSPWFSIRARGLLRLPCRVRASEDGLSEEVPKPGERVVSRVHLGPQCPAGQHLNLAALTASGTASGRSHGTEATAFRTTSRTTRP
jgi:hypothetical protein